MGFLRPYNHNFCLYVNDLVQLKKNTQRFCIKSFITMFSKLNFTAVNNSLLKYTCRDTLSYNKTQFQMYIVHFEYMY